MKLPSDVNERLPRFHDMMDGLSHLQAQGALEGVSPEALHYLEGAFPVGLSASNQVVLPESYNHEDGPPVLMLQDDDDRQNVWLQGDDAQIRTAENVIRRANVKDGIQVSPTILNGSVKCPTDSMGATTVNYAMYLPLDKGQELEFFLPRLIVVNSLKNLPTDMLGEVMVHEADHWRFSLEEVPVLQQSAANLTPKQLNAISEKRAYQLSYAMDANRGYHQQVATVDQLAERFAGISPKHMHMVTDEVRTQCKSAGFDLGVYPALATLTASALFGRPDEVMTPDELTAYRQLGHTR